MDNNMDTVSMLVKNYYQNPSIMDINNNQIQIRNIMEETVKINVEKLKEDIKKLVEEQKYLKDQRKTVHIKGERKMEPWQATMRHAQNREDLSIMYAILLVSKGWPIEEAAKAHLSKCFDWYYERLKKELQETLEAYQEEE